MGRGEESGSVIHSKNDGQAYETVRAALETAGGKHSFLMERSMVQYNDTAKWRMPVIDMTEDNIFVITIPEFSGNETQAKQYSHTLQDGISPDVQRVILDLRGNTGGNMYPMIAGANALLSDGIILKFRRRNGHDSNLTADCASANRIFDMGDGTKLVITTSCDVARTGEVFCDDLIVPDCPTDTPMDDALEWLLYRKLLLSIE